jgi:hypothetical protein
MFYSFADTKEKLDYLESSKTGREQPININWLIETLRETNEMAERYEKALKEIEEAKENYFLNEYVEVVDGIAQKALTK